MNNKREPEKERKKPYLSIDMLNKNLVPIKYFSNKKKRRIQTFFLKKW